MIAAVASESGPAFVRPSFDADTDTFRRTASMERAARESARTASSLHCLGIRMFSMIDARKAQYSRYRRQIGQVAVRSRSLVGPAQPGHLISPLQPDVAYMS